MAKLSTNILSTAKVRKYSMVGGCICLSKAVTVGGGPKEAGFSGTPFLSKDTNWALVQCNHFPWRRHELSVTAGVT